MSRRKATQASVEYALLGFLEDAPLHGYDLHQQLQAAHALGLVWRVKQAQLYALISKLESEGLIAAEVVPQDTRPPKRLLHLTAAGRAAFYEWRTLPVAHGRDIRIEFMAKLYWAQRRDWATVEQLIANQRAVTQTLLHAVQSEAAANADDHPYASLVLQFRQGQLEAVLAWLDTCTTTLVPVLIPISDERSAA